MKEFNPLGENGFRVLQQLLAVRRAPCKLNNVKTRQHQKRTEVLFASERTCGKVSENDFFEAKS